MPEHDPNNNLPPDAEKEEVLRLLSELYKTPHLTQREISLRLNVSLGKVNYLLKSLIQRGWLSAKAFSKNPDSDMKMRRAKYLITSDGFKEKLRLAHHFLKRKEEEYKEMKEEWERLSTMKNEFNLDISTE